MYPKKGENAIRAFAGIRASVLYEKLPYAYQMAEEIARIQNLTMTGECTRF